MKPMVNYLLAMLLILVGITAQAQEFVFNYNEMEMEEVEMDLAAYEHPFGSDFTTMMQLLSENYTYEEKNSISQTTSTIVSKPSIYYSVRKTSKHLIKSVKKGHMDVEDAKKELGDILVKALNIRYQNTEALEQKLNKMKDPQSILTLYSKEISLDM